MSDRTLEEAIAELRRIATENPDKHVWTLTPAALDRVILNAVLSGALVPALKAAEPEPEGKTLAEETPGQFLARVGTDARKWAEAFHQTALRLGYSDMDEGWLIGWFANAIEAARAASPAPHLEADRDTLAALDEDARHG